MHTPRCFSLPPRFFWLLLFAALALQPVGSFAQTAGVAHDLGALEAKFKADKDAIGAARDQSLAAAQKTYEAALVDGEQKYTSAGKANEVQAILEEKKRLDSGKLGPSAPPLLPKTLNPARAAYQRDIEKAEREHLLRNKQISDEYLRTLGSLEATARMNKQETLLQQIGILKRELLGGPAGPAPAGGAPLVLTGTNVMPNADFSEKGKDDVPAKWRRVGPATFAVMTEGGTSFLRLTSGTEKPQSAIRQDFARPSGAKELAISVKIRCLAMKGKGKFGIDSNQRSAKDLVDEHDPFPPGTDEIKNWKQFSGVIKLEPATTLIVFRMYVVSAIASVDFKDLHVEFR